MIMKNLTTVALLSLFLLFSCKNSEGEKVGTIEKTEIGRYQFLINSEFRSESVILDTQTGRIWQRTCVVTAKTRGGDCEYSAWMVPDIEGITIGRDVIMKMAK